jgi:hypothetical protein
VVDGLPTLIGNRTKKPLAIALSGVGRGTRRRDSGGDLTNVQYKPIWNCHNESPCTTNISKFLKKTRKRIDFSLGDFSRRLRF